MSLPLPLSPFEQYTLLDDNPDYPMAFAIRLTVVGKLNPALFELAVTTAVERHPLLNATLETVDDQLSWVAAASQSIAIQFSEQSRVERSLKFDLTSEPGLRIQVGSTTENDCELTFQFHHACSDGIGGFRFIDDVLVAYHNAWCDAEQTPAAKVKQATLDAAVLVERANITQKRSRWSLPYRIGLGVARAVRFLTKEPIQITCNRAGSSETSMENQNSVILPNCDDYKFDVGQLERLRNAAARNSSSLNDVLLATAFASLFAWQSQQTERSDGFIRLGVPVNLRARRHVKLSAANVVSVTFLDRTAKQSHDQAKLLQGITRQMNGIKNRKSATFVRVMRYLGNHKRFRHMVRSDRVFISATVSNLGPVLRRSSLPRTSSDHIRFANAIVEDVDIQGPVRSTMTLFFAVFSYANRLKSCLAYAAKTFDESDAAKLNADFAERLMSVVDESDSPIPQPRGHASRDIEKSTQPTDSVE